MTTGQDICVLGAGLIGGSILRAVGPIRGFGWNRGEAGVRAARQAGFDVDSRLPEVLQRAAERDALVVCGVPMPAVGAVFDAIARYSPQVALTDVVSVKGPVVAAARERGLADRFVGGHPMAGTARSGWSATDPELFRGATWMVATDDDPDPQVWRRVAALAGECGSRVIAADSVEHDRAVASISHLPHVLAEALAAGADSAGPLALALAAGSFRDATRVAGTAPELVRAICEPNDEALLSVLDEFLSELGAVRDSLAAGRGLGRLVDRGHAGRLAFERLAYGADPTTGRQPVSITPGEPGWAGRARDAGRMGLPVRLAGT